MRAFGLGRARALDNGYCALGHGLVGLGRGRARSLDNGYCALSHGLVVLVEVERGHWTMGIVL